MHEALESCHINWAWGYTAAVPTLRRQRWEYQGHPWLQRKFKVSWTTWESKGRKRERREKGEERKKRRNKGEREGGWRDGGMKVGRERSSEAGRQTRRYACIIELSPLNQSRFAISSFVISWLSIAVAIIDFILIAQSWQTRASDKYSCWLLYKWAPEFPFIDMFTAAEAPWQLQEKPQGLQNHQQLPSDGTVPRQTRNFLAFAKYFEGYYWGGEYSVLWNFMCVHTHSSVLVSIQNLPWYHLWYHFPNFSSHWWDLTCFCLLMGHELQAVLD